jgi:hypothetical protein
MKIEGVCIIKEQDEFCSKKFLRRFYNIHGFANSLVLEVPIK